MRSHCGLLIVSGQASCLNCGLLEDASDEGGQNNFDKIDITLDEIPVSG